MNEEQIRDEARIAANRSQFRSNHSYDHKSYEDGFYEGRSQAMLTDPSRLKQLVWDGLLTAQYQDEQWDDEDTCRLIVSKIMNDGPITYPDAKI